MNLSTILELPTASARVAAALASPLYRGNASPANSAAREAEAAVRRQLGLGSGLSTHSAALWNGQASEVCAECMEAVRELGVPQSALIELAQAYELLFEKSQGGETFPSSPVWLNGELREGDALIALRGLLPTSAYLSKGGTGSPYQAVVHSHYGYAEAELHALLEAVHQGIFFQLEAPLSALGQARHITLGDLLRIALFVGFAHMAGVAAAQAPQVRELAVDAIVANR